MKILVVGKAKTGTTIISKSIEKSMPGPAPTYYLEPKSRDDLDRIAGEGAPAMVVKIIYEHWAGKPGLRRDLLRRGDSPGFDKTVFIVRDIRDEMISRLLYVVFPQHRKKKVNRRKLTRWINTLKVKEENPESLSFLDLCAAYKEIFGGDFLQGFLQNEAKDSLDYSDLVLSSRHDKQIVKYEDFISGNLGRLDAHLGFTVTPTENLDGLERTRRSRSRDNWKSMFTARDVTYFQPALREQLEKSGYADWELDPADRLNPEHFSKYVERLIGV